jgi:hypothetical protein
MQWRLGLYQFSVAASSHWFDGKVFATVCIGQSLFTNLPNSTSTQQHINTTAHQRNSTSTQQHINTTHYQHGSLGLVVYYALAHLSSIFATAPCAHHSYGVLWYFGNSV